LNVNQPKFYLPAKPVLLFATFIERFFNLIKKKPPFHKRSMDFFTKSVELDVSKSKNLLGFESEVNINEGVGRTVSWYIKKGLLFLLITVSL